MKMNTIPPFKPNYVSPATRRAAARRERRAVPNAIVFGLAVEQLSSSQRERLAAILLRVARGLTEHIGIAYATYKANRQACRADAYRRCLNGLDRLVEIAALELNVPKLTIDDLVPTLALCLPDAYSSIDSDAYLWPFDDFAITLEEAARALKYA